MISVRRLLPAALGTLAALLVPIVGTSPAQGVGTGSPAILTPADGEAYYSHEVPDLVVDFAAAPYGSYDWSVTDTSTQQVLHSGTFVYDAADPDQNDLADLGDLGPGGYTATVTGSGAPASSSFGAFELGPPPSRCEVRLPATVRVVAASTAVYPRFDGCAGTSETWAIRHRVGTRTLTYGTVRVLDGRSAGPWRFRDSWPTGTYEVRSRTPGGSSTSTVVKLGSRISLTAGAKVAGRFRLSGDVTRYLPAADGFRAWANRPVAISYKNCAAGCPWRFLVTDHTDRSGHFTLGITSDSVRYWRATVASTSQVWGRTSTAVRR